MKVGKCEGYLSRVEGNVLLLETPLGPHVLEEFTALDKVHHEVDAIGALEHIVHGDDEGMIYLQHN